MNSTIEVIAAQPGSKSYENLVAWREQEVHRICEEAFAPLKDLPQTIPAAESVRHSAKDWLWQLAESRRQGLTITPVHLPIELKLGFVVEELNSCYTIHGKELSATWPPPDLVVESFGMSSEEIHNALMSFVGLTLLCGLPVPTEPTNEVDEILAEILMTEAEKESPQAPTELDLGLVRKTSPLKTREVPKRDSSFDDLYPQD